MATMPLLNPAYKPDKTGPSPLEIDRINATIIQLNEAKKAPNERVLLQNLQAAYANSRLLVRGRLD